MQFRGPIWRDAHGDARSAVEEFRRERGALDVEMVRDVTEDARERADAEVRMVGDRHVMFAALRRREAHVAARLSRDRVPIAAERTGEIAP